MRIRFGLFATIACAAWLPTAQAQLDESTDSAAARYPERPKLTLNDRPAVCGVLEREVVTRFTTPGRSLDLTIDLLVPEHNEGGWLGFAQPPARMGLIGRYTVRVFEWDVERDD